ncbi:Lymphocyte antigen 6L precursor [Mus musculus]|uniref:Lymphocyte antigen 6L precursor n=1 Tax=Mus musculus TaxID=10090 RepID=UPI0003D71F20|nr:Lymphocyte antigen 6L precursor [Mus musculus]
MTQLLLVLWTSVVSVQLTGAMMVVQVPARNLTCFECFKVSQASQCQPIQCEPNEKVCVSREVLHFLKIKRSTQISKHCATACPNSSVSVDLSLSIIPISIHRNCCSWDLCNRAPENWEGFWSLPVRLLLPMGLGLFCTLL